MEQANKQTGIYDSRTRGAQATHDNTGTVHVTLAMQTVTRENFTLTTCHNNTDIAQPERSLIGGNHARDQETRAVIGWELPRDAELALSLVDVCHTGWNGCAAVYKAIDSGVLRVSLVHTSVHIIEIR